MPPATSSRTVSAVCAGDRPTLGLTMVPISGPVATPASRRVPAMPKAGPGAAAANAAGSRRSSSRSPETWRSSNRLPATVDTRLGSEGPKLSSGQDSVSRQRV